MERTRVAVAGAAGRMGRTVIKAILAQDDMELAAAIDPAAVGQDAGLAAGDRATGIVIRPDLARALQETRAEVLVDFTTPSIVEEHIQAGLAQGVAIVVGTTGINAEALARISAQAAEYRGRVMIAPNFALGAVLMMHFAAIAARYFPRSEIVELHHDAKLDAPSGTAIKTAEMILAIRQEGLPERPGQEKLAGARGADMNGLHLHSIRLPGLVAHQEVIFGLEGQVLSIRHDSFDRTSFMPGVLLAIREVRNRPGVTYGLEKLLDL